MIRIRIRNTAPNYDLSDHATYSQTQTGATSVAHPDPFDPDSDPTFHFDTDLDPDF